MNVHIQLHVKKMQGVDCDLEELDQCSHCHHSELDSIKREQSQQKEFNCCMEAKMLDLEGTIEAQGEEIIALEEEITVLKTRKACKCREMEVAIVGSHWGQGHLETGVYMLGIFQVLAESSSNVPTKYISFTFHM